MRRSTLALRPLLSLPLSLLLLFTFSDLALAAEDDRHADEDAYEETARVARLSLVRGDVSVRRAGGGRWERAALNLPLVEGDRLTTGADSHLEIQIDARNFLRVGEHATLDIVTLRDEGVALSLPEGTATLRLARFDREREYFEIDAPGTTVAAERAGLYRIDVTQRSVRVTVRSDGRARIYSATSGFTLRHNRTAELVRLDGADETDWDFSDAASLDPWDTWVGDRERYLAERLRHDGRDRYYDSAVWGAEELDAYGDWVSHRDYGHVWRPRVTVINNYYNWAPYRHGHWRWLPHYGWTWVGDEPWGWAPYHYGRWVFVDNYWCWAPRGYVGYRNRSWWRPALVAFVFVPGLRGEHVAWYPLPYHHRDPHSNFWRRAVSADKLRSLSREEMARLRGAKHPAYERAVSSLPAREFGAAGRGRPADEEIARKALAGEPVRGKLPVRPIDTPGAPAPALAREKTGGRIPGALRNETGAARAGAGPPAGQLAERPTGAARRQPGVALDEELRRGRIFNNRDSLFGKPVKTATGDAGGDRDANGADGGGRAGAGEEGRGTGAVARPTRPVRTAPDPNGGGVIDKGARDRVRPVRPVAPEADDAVEKQPGWKSQPIERPGRPDSGGGYDGGGRERRRERTRPEASGEKHERPAYRPEPQPEERPAPRYERPERKEPPAPREEERPAPRYERPSPPPQREERPAPPPREERQPPPQREEKRSEPREKGDAPARRKPIDND
jgi:hypothetical protein